jgi:hypothetical protein
MQTGYWQVYLAKCSQEKASFYTATRKKHYLVMSMGLLNAMTFFIAMIAVMKKNGMSSEIVKKVSQVVIQNVLLMTFYFLEWISPSFYITSNCVEYFAKVLVHSQTEEVLFSISANRICQH